MTDFTKIRFYFLNFHGFFGSEMIRKIVTKYCFRFCFSYHTTLFQKCNLFFHNCLDFFRSYVMLGSKNICFDKYRRLL